jgi:hypothetical protein
MKRSTIGARAIGGEPIPNSADAIDKLTNRLPPNKAFQLTASREILAFLKAVGGALAAAERQAVGPRSLRTRMTVSAACPFGQDHYPSIGRWLHRRSDL